MVTGMLNIGRVGGLGAGTGGGTVQPLSITAPRGYAGRDDQFPMSIANTISVADSEDVGGTYTVTMTLSNAAKVLTRAGWTGTPGDVISRNATIATINSELAAALQVSGYAGDFSDNNTIRFVRDADGAEITRSFGVAAIAPLSSAVINNDVADGTLLDTVQPTIPGASLVITNYTATLDEVAPALTVPFSIKTGTTTGTIGATTDTNVGDMDMVLTQSATPPDADQVIAGTDENDVAADVAGTQAITTTGAKTFDITGLTSEDTYYGYIVHVDARGNVSDVFACGSFTTDAVASFTDPSDITDSIWFDFSDTANMWSDGSRATAIADNVALQEIQAKGDYTTLPAFVQATSGNRPTWQDTGFASFDGVNDFLQLASTLFAASMDTFDEITVFYAGNVATASNTIIFGEGRSSTTFSAYYPLTSRNGGSNDELCAYLADNTGGDVVAGTVSQVAGVLDDTLRVLGMNIDNVGEDVTGYNETTAQTTNAFNASPGATTLNQTTIGAYMSGGTTPSNFANMDLYQLVIVPRALTTQEISDLVGWLKTKVGL